jgi:membrane protein
MATSPQLALESRNLTNKPLVAGGWIAPITFIKTLVAKITHDECPMMAAAMAFAFLGSFIPTLFFVISILGIFGKQGDTLTILVHALSSVAPPAAMDLIKSAIEGIIQSSNKGLSIVGFLGAIWASSRGAAGIVHGLNRAYNIPAEKPPFWYEPLMSIFIILTLGTSLLIVSNLIFFGEPMITWIIQATRLPASIEVFLQIIRWLISIFSVLGCSTVIYGFLLKFKLKQYYWRAAAIGSIVFTILWLGFSLIFGLYIKYFHGYNPVYGSLGALALLLTWLYLSAMSILIAGEIISILAVPSENIDIAEKCLSKNT